MTGIAPRPPAAPVFGLVALCALLSAPPAGAVCPTQCPSPAGWSQAFSFAGFVWERKGGCGGPGPNCWAPDNVELVPGEGVRLRLTQRQGKWYAAEFRTVGPVPTGSYSAYLIGRTDLLDPNVVLGFFLYDDAAGERSEPCPDELDLESSRFGDPSAPNGHFVSYASGVCGPSDLGSFDYALTGTHATHQIDWAPGAVVYRMLHGHRCAPELPDHVIGERSFVSPLVPAAGGLRLHVNLWAFAGNAPTDRQEVEIVLRDIVPTCAGVAAASPPSEPDWALAVRHVPSRGSADIHLALPRDDRLRVTIVDVAGRRVVTLADGVFPAGRHQWRWDAAASTPGVYFVRLDAGGRTLSRRIVLLE